MDAPLLPEEGSNANHFRQHASQTAMQGDGDNLIRHISGGNYQVNPLVRGCVPSLGNGGRIDCEDVDDGMNSTMEVNRCLLCRCIRTEQSQSHGSVGFVCLVYMYINYVGYIFIYYVCVI